MYNQPERDEMLFFTRRHYNGQRLCRKVGNTGTWKSVGEEHEIKDAHQLLGHWRSLVFYRNDNGNLHSTEWRMDEYRVFPDEVYIKIFFLILMNK